MSITEPNFCEVWNVVDVLDQSAEMVKIRQVVQSTSKDPLREHEINRETFEKRTQKLETSDGIFIFSLRKELKTQ